MSRIEAQLPTPVQELLLKACLLEGDEQIQADAALRTATSLDDLDAGSHRLLPLYYRRVFARRTEDADHGRLRGVHRKSWYENLILRTRAEQLLVQLNARGIETILLKGGGLHTTVYAAEPTLRPLDDIDVMVRLRDAATAIQIVEELGYACRERQLYGNAWPGIMHSSSYLRGYRESVDLHCRPLRFQRDSGFTQRCWDRSVQVKFGEASTRTLDPTDHLLIAISHGSMPNKVPTCRWVADAVLLSRSAHIEWDRLADDAVATWHPELVEVGLRYLQSTFHIAIPETAMMRLKAPQPRFWKLLDSISEHPNSRWRRMLAALATDYLMAHFGERPWALIRGYPRFVQLRNHRGFAGSLKRIAHIIRSSGGRGKQPSD
jgi:hypothetical protein